MEFSLRFADPKKDASKILAIYAPYILNTTITFEYEVPTIDVFRQRMDEIMKKFPWIVCEADGILAGYAYANKQFERTAYRWNAELSVYIAPNYHGIGIGSALYEALIGLLKQLGYRNASVRIQIPNNKSVALHRSFGFEEVGIMRCIGNKFGQWLDMLYMIKQLGEFEEFPPPPLPVDALDRRQTQEFLNRCARQIRFSHSI